MATFTSKEIINVMIANDGYYEDDPPPLAIYEYVNTFNQTLWCVVYTSIDEASLRRSSYVKQETIKLLWRRVIERGL